MATTKTERPSISAIIPTYQEEGYIEETLIALAKAIRETKQTKTRSELIVVDSGTDRTFEKAKKFAENAIRLSIRGVSKARNFGASKAQSDILVFIDADVIVSAGVLDEISRKLKDNNVVAVVSYVLPRDNEKMTASKRLFFKLDRFFIKRLVKGSSAFLRFYTRGDLIAVRREAFMRVGGFNEELHCMETTELLEKLLKIGRIEVLDTPIFETCRRINHYGLAKNYLIWYRNFASYMLLKKPFSTTWEPIR